VVQGTFGPARTPAALASVMAMQPSTIDVIDLRPTDTPGLFRQHELLHLGMDLNEIRIALEVLSAELRSQWTSALERGHFNDVTRLAEASHAVHRAALALTSDSVV
jgi:hypothetical protein